MDYRKAFIVEPESKERLDKIVIKPRLGLLNGTCGLQGFESYAALRQAPVAFADFGITAIHVWNWPSSTFPPLKTYFRF